MPQYAIRVVVKRTRDHGDERERLPVDPVTEHAVCARRVADFDGLGGAVQGVAGAEAADGDEGLFFEAPSEFLPAGFFVEITVAVEGGGEGGVGHG